MHESGTYIHGTWMHGCGHDTASMHGMQQHATTSMDTSTTNTPIHSFGKLWYGINVEGCGNPTVADKPTCVIGIRTHDTRIMKG